MHHLAEVDFHFTAVAIAGHQAVAGEGLVQAGQAVFDGLVAAVQLGALGVHVGLGGGVQLAVQLQLARLQTQALEAMVDGADVFLLEALQFAVELVGALEAGLQLGPGGSTFGDHAAFFLDADQVAVEVAPLATLQGDQVGRVLFVDQPVADHPGEVAAVEVAVTHLDQLASHELRPLVRHRQAGALQAGTGYFFLLHHFANDDVISLARHLVGGLDQVGRPEVAQAAHGDHRQQADGHDHCHGHRAAAHPDAWGAALEPAFEGILFHGSLPFYQSDEYFLRRRWRISSAKVFMMKVNISSTRAARNSTR
ncbi:hypothetical protein D3C81_896780 [compost metagenome]